MKIVHITTVHPVNDNRIFYKECQTLSKNGYDISLIVAGEKNSIIDGVKIIGLKKEKGRIKRMIYTSFFDLINLCKNIDADVYHFHDPEIIFAALILKFKGKKVIYDVHENNPASIMSKPYISSRITQILISKCFSILEKVSSKFFDAIVTARPDISKRFNHRNLITLKNFPILPNLKNVKNIDIKKDKSSVIFVGGMTTIRGISELIDAFTLIPNIELWLLGPIKEEYLKDKISNQENIKYFGIVEPDEVFSFIKKADIGIITFLPFPNHIETLATKPFEYMACGKPMIMSNFIYWKETFLESSLYVDPENPKNIADTILALLSDKVKFDNMSLMNLELSKHNYNWEKESVKLVNLYGELLK